MKKKYTSEESLGALVYLVQEQAMVQERYPINAQNNLESFAQIARCSKDTRQKLLDINKRVNGQFLYTGEEGDYYLFEQWHTKRLFKVWKDSIQNNKADVGDLVILSLVYWDDKWWLSGMMASTGKPTEEPDMSKANYSFYANTEETQQKFIQITALNEQAFLKTFGKLIYFVRDKIDFEQNYLRFYKNYYKIAFKKGIIKITQQEFMNNVKPMISNLKSQIKDIHEGGTAMIFEKNVGLRLQYGYAEAIRLLQLPSISFKEIDLLYDLIITIFPYILTEYIIDNYPTKNLRFPVGDSTLDVVKYWKFLHQWNNPNEYSIPVPNMRTI